MQSRCSRVQDYKHGAVNEQNGSTHLLRWLLLRVLASFCLDSSDSPLDSTRPPSLIPFPAIPPQLSPAPTRPPSVLAVGLGGDTGAVSDQQSHCASAGHRDRHAGGAHGPRARLVGGGVALVGVGAHVTLELRGRLALYPAQLAEQHAAGPCPAESPPRPAALLPLLAVVLLGVDTQVGEGGEACGTRAYRHVKAW